jgi:KamA family protein
MKIYTARDLERIPQLAALGPAALREMQIVAKVLPFRVNNYVIEQLIDWSAVPGDPIFRLVFPNREMLDEQSFAQMARVTERTTSLSEERRAAAAIRDSLNPHPADQLWLNRPFFEGERITGLQHKYPQTVLFFPSEAQTCHSFCTFCFRWPQFVRDNDLRIAMSDRDRLKRYLIAHSEVTDLLLTGGDALTMKAHRLRFFLEPLVEPALHHIKTVRLGTKALSFWPHRFVTDPDADDLIKVIEWLINQGKNVAIMAHYNHWRELSTAIAEEAIARLRQTGAVLRSQGPLLRGINDDARVWSALWLRQVQLGIVPYYMFVARDTGPKYYFDVPLARAWSIYAEAARQVSGLGRTVRGPSMSTGPGKIGK